MDNRYYSPEVSETDEKNPDKRKVIIRDIGWRSLTVSLLFLNQSGTFNLIFYLL